MVTDWREDALSIVTPCARSMIDRWGETPDGCCRWRNQPCPVVGFPHGGHDWFYEGRGAGIGTVPAGWRHCSGESRMV